MHGGQGTRRVDHPSVAISGHWDGFQPGRVHIGLFGTGRRGVVAERHLATRIGPSGLVCAAIRRGGGVVRLVRLRAASDAESETASPITGAAP